VIINPFPFEGAILETNSFNINFTLFDYQEDSLNYTVKTTPNIGNKTELNVDNGFYTVPIGDIQDYGNYKWEITVTDGTNTVYDEINFKIVQSGIDVVPPVAIAGSDFSINEGFVAIFDASESYDNVGIYEYRWTFIDDTSQVLYGISPQYLFKNPGEYSVSLTVTDLSGYQDIDRVIVTVKDITRPVANGGNDVTVNVNEIIELDASSSSDNTGIIKYRWQMDDGTVLRGKVIQYSYSEAGTYNITLTVYDLENNYDSDYIIVEVLPPEGHEFYLILIFFVFFMGVIIAGYIIYTKRMQNKKKQEKNTLYRLP
jgi:PKD repeat protein